MSLTEVEEDEEQEEKKKAYKEEEEIGKGEKDEEKEELKHNKNVYITEICSHVSVCTDNKGRVMKWNHTGE